MRSLALLLPLVAVGVACSSAREREGFAPVDAGIDAVPEASAKPATLTCSWLFGADNCWLSALKAAGACLPDAQLAGALDMTKGTCGYADGTSVTFSPYPVSTPQGQTPAWSFSIAKKGVPCMAIESATHPLGNGEHTKLTTSLGTVTLSYVDGAATLTCPDGSSVQNASFHDLLDCELGVETLPGEGWGDDGSSSYFWLFYGVGAARPDDHVTAWSCKH